MSNRSLLRMYVCRKVMLVKYNYKYYLGYEIYKLYHLIMLGHQLLLHYRITFPGEAGYYNIITG
jgi:hypothetical protein